MSRIHVTNQVTSSEVAHEPVHVILTRRNKTITPQAAEAPSRTEGLTRKEGEENWVKLEQRSVGSKS